MQPFQIVRFQKVLHPCRDKIGISVVTPQVKVSFRQVFLGNNEPPIICAGGAVIVERLLGAA